MLAVIVILLFKLSRMFYGKQENIQYNTILRWKSGLQEEQSLKKPIKKQLREKFRVGKCNCQGTRLNAVISVMIIEVVH